MSDVLSNCDFVAAKIPQTQFLNFEVTEPIFTMLSNDEAAFTPRLIRAFTKRYCILFRNVRAKSEDGQFRCLQIAPEIN